MGFFSGDRDSLGIARQTRFSDTSIGWGSQVCALSRPPKESLRHSLALLRKWSRGGSGVGGGTGRREPPAWEALVIS